MSNQELQLLITAIKTQAESEADGVKYIFMDDNTVYRFENNRMKKVGAALLKKAKKIIDAGDDIKPKKTKQTKQPKQTKIKETSDNEDDDNEDNEDDDNDEEPEEIIKPKKIKQPKQPKQIKQIKNDIDLNEYWQTKSKLEYQERELERLNGKITKLKQYKNIVNRLTNGEYEPNIITTEPKQDAGRPAWQQENEIKDNKPRYNDSLFMF